jgi:ribonuclease-3
MPGARRPSPLGRLFSRRAPGPVEERLGYRFHDPALLEQALTHSTFVHENPAAGIVSNERLEFLGDAVIDLLVGRILFERLESANEGELSRRRAGVVRREGLAALARELDLGPALRLGAGHKKVVLSDTTLSDAYEAVAGAIFLDGGYEMVERCLGPRLAAAIESATGASDAKTALQEACQARGLPLPTYEVLSVSGPDHARIYSCAVRVGDRELGRGEGASKKLAEQRCAESALSALRSPEEA